MLKPKFNDATSARPELLCYLVAIAAASYALSQEWRVDHVVECCRQWLKKNGCTMHWLDRVRIGQLALKIASQDLIDAGIAVGSHVRWLPRASVYLSHELKRLRPDLRGPSWDVSSLTLGHASRVAFFSHSTPDEF